MSTKFKKNKEDFVCEKCGTEVKGNGFTNHCSKCLWSKHVDIFPGDRMEECGGLMEPVDAIQNGGEWSVVQKCEKCGKIHKNKLSPDDNFNALLDIKKNN
jgi:hypothetical protein